MEYDIEIELNLEKYIMTCRDLKFFIKDLPDITVIDKTIFWMMDDFSKVVVSIIAPHDYILFGNMVIFSCSEKSICELAKDSKLVVRKKVIQEVFPEFIKKDYTSFRNENASLYTIMLLGRLKSLMNREHLESIYAL